MRPRAAEDRWPIVALAATILVGVCTTGVAALADSLDDWLNGQYMTGDWGGMRSKLEQGRGASSAC